MKIFYNSIIPFKGFLAINLFGILFVRNEYKNNGLTHSTINHESIHTEQIKELGYVFFYILYFIEWLIKIPFSWFMKNPRGVKNWAYKSISFEQEAFYNSKDYTYLYNRKHYNWFNFIFKMYEKK
jgi:hypothetical protein